METVPYLVEDFALVVPSHPFRHLSGPWLCDLVGSRAINLFYGAAFELGRHE